MSEQAPGNPLHTLRVVEFEGIGPGPLAGLMLANLGAQVTVITRPTPLKIMQEFGGDAGNNPLRQNKRIVALDLKTAAGVEQALELVAVADALIEANRPGVMERLGIGPDECAARNPRLVYGRMTGWGQTGPLAQSAGHDLNYLALTGLLSLSARSGEAPIAAPTVMGDAAGSLGLCFGIVSAVLDARISGQGRVVDAAIVDVVAMLGTIVQLARASGQIDGAEPSPFHDSPFYDSYICADGHFITVGALETQFYAILLAKLGLTDVDPASQYDRKQWPALKARFAELFASRPRDHWCEILEGSDACFAPVLNIAEAVNHAHNRARGIYRETSSGLIETAPAPRFSVLNPAR
ncbi:CaiB/BaiF CoA-transferase family protein [Phyllobacterium sp. P30BS-XVII]|uniref:CaiB/BaiF CoA transferase family protein n=1 Tax=Phyllobacterium sp. P30BS-XVII TaxID=2587046 RepID=UPI0015F7E405|nr:CaiB/BaiF CoA-transferase family protein [Phyllobacterium sp. P30BS-XVII]MBA8901921.1 alpha-methylacyl-CoA racemase [Phyllobacterium sp. P30BS-XVII]